MLNTGSFCFWAAVTLIKNQFQEIQACAILEDFPCETKKNACFHNFFFFYGNTKLFNLLGCQDCSCVVNPADYLFITGFVFIYPFSFLFKTLDHSNFRQISNLLLISLKLAISCSNTYIILAIKVFDDQLLSLSPCS